MRIEAHRSFQWVGGRIRSRDAGAAAEANAPPPEPAPHPGKTPRRCAGFRIDRPAASIRRPAPEPQFGGRGNRLSARRFPAVDRRVLRRARPVARPLPRPTPETRNARRCLAALTAEECRGLRRNATRGQVGTACGRRHQRRERCATSGRCGSETGHPDAQGGTGHSASHRGRTSGQASKSEAELHDPHGVGMGVQSSAAPRAVLRTLRRSRWICRGRGSSVACPALRARAGRLTRALLVRSIQNCVSGEEAP